MSEELVQRLFWHVEKVLGPVSDEPIVNAHDSDRVVLLFNFRAEAKRAVEYWYRQGKDDQYQIDAPIIKKQAAEIQRLAVVNQALRKQRNKANNAIRDLDFANCAETIDTVAAQDIEIERLASRIEELEATIREITAT